MTVDMITTTGERWLAPVGYCYDYCNYCCGVLVWPLRCIACIEQRLLYWTTYCALLVCLLATVVIVVVCHCVAADLLLLTNLTTYVT